MYYVIKFDPKKCDSSDTKVILESLECLESFIPITASTFNNIVTFEK